MGKENKHLGNSGFSIISRSEEHYYCPPCSRDMHYLICASSPVRQGAGMMVTETPCSGSLRRCLPSGGSWGPGHTTGLTWPDQVSVSTPYYCQGLSGTCTGLYYTGQWYYPVTGRNSFFVCVIWIEKYCLPKAETIQYLDVFVLL